MTKRTQAVVAVASGLFFLIAILIISFARPRPTDLEYLVFRIILALAAAAFATAIPGTLEIELANWLRSGGALAVFVIVYFYNPAKLAVNAAREIHSEPQQTTSQPPASQSVERSPTPADRSSSITFDEIKHVLDSRRIFSDEFRRQHQGETVEWTVKVMQVERLLDPKVDSDFLVKIGSKSEDPNKSRDFAEAIFPVSVKDDMINVGFGDQIRFSGTLVFRDSWYVVVENCKLLEHHNKPQ